MKIHLPGMEAALFRRDDEPAASTLRELLPLLITPERLKLAAGLAVAEAETLPSDFFLLFLAAVAGFAAAAARFPANSARLNL